MAKGALFKKEVTDIILKTFPNSFLYNDGKEIRICGNEEGEQIQLKVALTCAKVNVNVGDDVVVPGSGEINFEEKKEEPKRIEPTQEEKDNVQMLANLFNL